MGTILARTRASGTRYTALIRIKRGGRVVHTESQTFERRTTAATWLKNREAELERPGALEEAKAPKFTLAHAIDRYVEGSERALGRTKKQVLRTIKTKAIAEMDCADIKSDDVVKFVSDMDGVTPQTRGNYVSHLASVFAVARPAWGIPLDQRAMTDAQVVLKRLGVIAKSRKRDRRPTLDELEKILAHFQDRQKRRPEMAPMARIVVFAIFSTRRQEEITRIRWEDFDKAHSRVLVRDMKNPGEKVGNDIWCDLPDEAVRVIESMPRNGDLIFPFSTDAISANFTRAGAFLGIEDLHFHDLRHDGVSRLFEMGRTIPQAASVSGHRSWQSLQRYAHLRQVGDKYENWPWLERVTR